jgi:hypothetical protein
VFFFIDLGFWLTWLSSTYPSKRLPKAGKSLVILTLRETPPLLERKRYSAPGAPCGAINAEKSMRLVTRPVPSSGTALNSVAPGIRTSQVPFIGFFLWWLSHPRSILPRGHGDYLFSIVVFFLSRAGFAGW